MVYKLAADDFGVMRYSATPLQDVARWLEKKPPRQVLKALDEVRRVGLVSIFEHQDEQYVYQQDWQTWQKITHPRQTKQPSPPLDGLDRNTVWLFSHHPKGGKLPSWQHPEEREKPGAHREKAGSAPGENRERTGSASV